MAGRTTPIVSGPTQPNKIAASRLPGDARASDACASNGYTRRDIAIASHLVPAHSTDVLLPEMLPAWRSLGQRSGGAARRCRGVPTREWQATREPGAARGH